MSVLKSHDGKGLIVNCGCGNDERLHIRIRNDCKNNVSSKNNTYYRVTCLNANWYDKHGKKTTEVIMDKIRKIWAIIRDRDFSYFEIIINEKELKTFVEYINEIKQ